MEPVPRMELFGNGTSLVVLNTIGDEGKEVYGELRRITDASFTLAAIGVPDWNRDLSPWESPAVFGDKPFGGGADGYLRTLTDVCIPQAVSAMGKEPDRMVIAGYSLAGLFAIYSLYRTDVFDAAVSASGSTWFPGFTDFVARERMMSSPDRVYLSLGDRESLTKNPVMSTVGECTRSIQERLSAEGMECILELNPGNHFRDAALRTAKGIAWVLGPSK